MTASPDTTKQSTQHGQTHPVTPDPGHKQAASLENRGLHTTAVEGFREALKGPEAVGLLTSMADAARVILGRRAQIAEAKAARLRAAS